jgi:hypothetical protein
MKRSIEDDDSVRRKERLRLIDDSDEEDLLAFYAIPKARKKSRFKVYHEFNSNSLDEPCLERFCEPKDSTGKSMFSGRL